VQTPDFTRAESTASSLTHAATWTASKTIGWSRPWKKKLIFQSAAVQYSSGPPPFNPIQHPIRVNLMKPVSVSVHP